MQKMTVMKISRITRTLSLLLSLSLMLVCFGACATKDDGRKDISREALDYFNKGISAFNIAKCLSVCRATVIVEEEGHPENTDGFVLYFENLYHNTGNDTRRMTVTYQAKTPKALTILPPEMTKISTSYVKDGWIYYDEEGKNKFKLPLSEDYSNGLGLYSLGNASPGGSYGIIDEGVIRADLYFSPNQCEKSQAAFIENMNAVVFGAQEVDVTYSNMILSSLMQEKTNRLSSYTISFTGNCTVGGKNYTLRYTYSEQFTSYDIDAEIAYPDLSDFKRYENK